jgi:hypothetical protein
MIANWQLLAEILVKLSNMQKSGSGSRDRLGVGVVLEALVNIGTELKMCKEIQKLYNGYSQSSLLMMKPCLVMS